MLAFFLGALGGFVVSFVGRLAWDAYVERRRKDRLIRALLTDCVATLRKFDALMSDLQHSLGEPDGNNEFNRVRELPSGFIIDPPLLEVKELIFMLDSPNARPLMFLYDHWTRFRVFEERYVDTYARLIDILARCATASTDKAYYENLKLEYWSQVDGMRDQMHGIANQLRTASARQFKFASRNLGTHVRDRDLEILSNGYWPTWQSFYQQYPDLKDS